LENVVNAITRLPMEHFGLNVGGRMPSFSWHCPPSCGCHGNGRCLPTAQLNI